ncbi:SET and MYND domain-containing protein 4 [Halotydeus destructor]|nr:SET and MYND domain-containing protein 4 [Halotydeus destructor]
MKITELIESTQSSQSCLKDAMNKVMKYFIQDRIQLELNNKITGLNTIVYAKSDTKACHHRTKGNELFKQQKYEEAEAEYSKAITFATFPSIDNQENGKELATAFANRSMALLQSKRFTECLEDIDYAFRFNYQDSKKLHYRREQCKNKMAEEGDNVTPSKPVKSEPIQKIRISDGHNRVNRKRGCVASQDIQDGDIVLEESPYASVLKFGQLNVLCFECFKPLPARRFPCCSCSLVKYCSQACSELSWTRGHMFECGYTELWDRLFDKRCESNFALAFKMLIRDTVRKCLDSVRNTDCSSLHVQLLEEIANFKNSAQEDKDENQDGDEDVAKVSAYVLYFLNEYSKLSKLQLVESKDWSLIGGLLFLYHKHLISNCTQVNKRTRKVHSLKSTQDFDPLEDAEVGFAFYNVFNSINHSCKPNCVISFFRGNQIVLRAVQDISAGEEITVSYGPTWKSRAVLERKLYLKSNYGFDCDCSACVSHEQSNSQSMKCPKCQGPVCAPVEPEDTKCSNCDGQISKEQMEQANINLRISKMGSLKLITKDVDIRKAEHPLLEAHRFLSELFYSTHRDLGVIKEKLSFTYKVMRKYRLMIIYANDSMKCIEEEYDTYQLAYLNGLLKLIDRQRDLVEYVDRADKTNDKEYKDLFEDTKVSMVINLKKALSLAANQVEGGHLEVYQKKINELLVTYEN